MAFFLALLPILGSQETLGPTKGSLLLAGGSAKDPAIFRRFIELAGGPDATIIVIPTASNDVDPQQESYQRFTNLFKNHGAENVSVLHTRDRDIADSERFIAPLEKADGVWFWGGRAARLADAYLETRIIPALERVLQRGGVIGGTSSGTLIQTELLLHGDSENTDLILGDHQQGFGFLQGVAVSTHFLARNRILRFLKFLETVPELMGIGIDNNTAIEVHGNQLQVIGQSYVVVYGIIGREEPFTLLSAGDRLDLKRRVLVGDCVGWSSGCVPE
jgi:cyanophycinase